MAIADDLRKTLTDPTPLYAVAGTVDLTAEKLREVPALIEKLRAEAPEKFAAARGGADPKAVQEKVADRAKEAQAKFNEIVASIDVKSFREGAQDFALHQVGRAAEAAVKARETYDDLAERGRGVVNNLRGEVAEEIEDVAVAIEPAAEPKPAAATEAKPAEAKAAPAKPAAKKAPARKPAAKRTTPAK
jgi:heparin binding hemagglutinin HbhA